MVIGIIQPRTLPYGDGDQAPYCFRLSLRCSSALVAEIAEAINQEIRPSDIRVRLEADDPEALLIFSNTLCTSADVCLMLHEWSTTTEWGSRNRFLAHAHPYGPMLMPNVKLWCGGRRRYVLRLESEAYDPSTVYAVLQRLKLQPGMTAEYSATGGSIIITLDETWGSGWLSSTVTKITNEVSQT